MIQGSIICILVSFVACLALRKPGMEDAVPLASNSVVESGKTSIDTLTLSRNQLAWQAVDRQCGSCHHGDRTDNTEALAVYNLVDSCWYCKLDEKQIKSFEGRISGSKFSEEERSAITGLFDEIPGSN